jgi:hypothetical protein
MKSLLLLIIGRKSVFLDESSKNYQMTKCMADEQIKNERIFSYLAFFCMAPCQPSTFTQISGTYPQYVYLRDIISPAICRSLFRSLAVGCCLTTTPSESS